MLASVLPGLRELRAPFAAGAVLLATLWVLLYDRVEPATRPGRIGVGLSSLSDLLGPNGRLAVASVASYLLGTVLVAGMRGAVRQLGARQIPRIANKDYVLGQQSLWDRTMAPLSRPSLARILEFCERRTGSVDLAHQVCIEIVFGGGKRLLVKNKDLYGEWDRMANEAEFRDAIALPILLFTVAAMTSVGWAIAWRIATVLSVSAVVVVLFLHARRLDREAYSMYAHAVADGVVTTAVIDERF